VKLRAITSAHVVTCAITSAHVVTRTNVRSGQDTTTTSVSRSTTSKQRWISTVSWRYVALSETIFCRFCLSVLFEECKKGDYVEDGSVEIFGGWLWRDMLVLEKETDDDVKVSIDSRPVLSGLLDGLKKGMGWEEKVFCDVALLRTSRCMKPVKLVE
jgi:hypothetical protein